MKEGRGRMRVRKAEGKTDDLQTELNLKLCVEVNKEEEVRVEVLSGAQL